MGGSTNPDVGTNFCYIVKKISGWKLNTQGTIKHLTF